MVVSLSVYDHLEAAPDHALRIEGQLLRVHHAGEALVLHRLGVHTVTLRARAVDDVRKAHRLVRFLLHRAQERGALAPGHVVRHAFAELERTVLAPDFAGEPRHAPVCGETALRHRG